MVVRVGLKNIYFQKGPDDNLFHVLIKETSNVLVCGHTHRPFFRKIQDFHFIYDGSVGHPKDGDWRANWVLITIENNQSFQVDFRRCGYDLESLRAVYEQAKLPKIFLRIYYQFTNSILRCETGRLPIFKDKP